MDSIFLASSKKIFGASDLANLSLTLGDYAATVDETIYELILILRFIDTRHFTLDPRHYTLDPRHLAKPLCCSDCYVTSSPCLYDSSNIPLA